MNGVFFKFICSEKAAKFCEIFTLFLTGTTKDKGKVNISQNFVAFSEYMNFNKNEIGNLKKYRQRFSFFSTCDERESLRLNGNSCALNMLLNVPVPKDIKKY
jgi:hypothetical protein